MVLGHMIAGISDMLSVCLGHGGLGPRLASAASFTSAATAAHVVSLHHPQDAHSQPSHTLQGLLLLPANGKLSRHKISDIEGFHEGS